MGKEKVAVIGGGGREAALVDKYLQSQHVGSAISIPGNEMMRMGQSKPVEIFKDAKPTDAKTIVQICKENNITFVDVAQDNAVEAGVVDALRTAGIRTLGPTRAAGRIEWSKAFARRFGTELDLPQPKYKICTSEQMGLSYLSEQPESSWFIKADGLCEGKGAFPAKNKKEARERIKEVVNLKNGAGRVYLIEDWLKSWNDSQKYVNGEEVSLFCISDGKTFKKLGSAQDHKMSHNSDQGKMTGGMGCSTPPLVLDELFDKTEADAIFKKTIEGLYHAGTPYTGILYLGGIILKGSFPQLHVIEFNARWGDNEAEVILPGLKSDLFEIGSQTIDGNLNKVKIETDVKSRIVVTGAAKGYPDNYHAAQKKRIFGLEEAMKMEGVKVYGAGIHVYMGNYYTQGGRLFHLVAEGKDVIEAKERAYAAMSRIFIEGNNLHFRDDIGWRDVQRHYMLRRERRA
jgi:phosphoribosylamine--glycine ligase